MTYLPVDRVVRSASILPIGDGSTDKSIDAGQCGPVEIVLLPAAIRDVNFKVFHSLTLIKFHLKVYIILKTSLINVKEDF